MEARRSCTSANASLYKSSLMLNPQYMYIKVCQLSRLRVTKAALKKKNLKCLHIYNQGNIHILQRSQHKDHKQSLNSIG